MLVPISELKINPGKYVSLVNTHDIYITKNGKKVAKLTSVQSEKIDSAKALFGILPTDVTLEQSRMERLS
jgi:prevent-host-death family protein